MYQYYSKEKREKDKYYELLGITTDINRIDTMNANELQSLISKRHFDYQATRDYEIRRKLNEFSQIAIKRYGELTQIRYIST